MFIAFMEQPPLLSSSSRLRNPFPLVSRSQNHAYSYSLFVQSWLQFNLHLNRESVSEKCVSEKSIDSIESIIYEESIRVQIVQYFSGFIINLEWFNGLSGQAPVWMITKMIQMIVKVF